MLSDLRNRVDGKGSTWAAADASEYSPIISVGKPYQGGKTTYRNVVVDSYKEVGFRFMNITMEKYNELRAWEEKNGLNIIYPMLDIYSEFCTDKSNANAWYKTDEKGNAILDANGLPQDFYVRDAEGNVGYYINQDKNMIQVRILY